MTDARLPGEAIPERAQDLIAEGDANDQPILTLEDRLLVALAGRGAQRIGQFLIGAYVSACGPVYSAQTFYNWLRSLSDEALVEAVEGAGNALGLHRPSGDERLADDGADSARGTVR